MSAKLIPLLLSACLLASAGCRKSTGTKKIRLGYFPNITHAQAIIGVSAGKFQNAVGTEVPIEPSVFNAGPSAIEAMFAGALDLTYVGPIPAINGYVKSEGSCKIIAGSCAGGSILVVRKDAGIKTAADFSGKTLATPQLGNSQDLSARAWLRRNGLKPKEKGGTVQVIPLANPDQLTLFLKKELHAAWTVEPWAARLIQEGNGTKFLNESELWKELTQGEYPTAVLLVNESFLRKNPELVKKFLAAHIELTHWIRSNPDPAKKIVNQEIKRLTGRALPEKILNDAFANVTFTINPIRKSLEQQAQWAFQEGFLGKIEPNLSTLTDLSVLNTLLNEKKLKPVEP